MAVVYVVIENTPGYMPEEDEPLETENYAHAVEYMNQRAAEYEEEGLRVEYGWASGANLAAVMVYDDSKMHDLGRYIGIELAEEE